MTITTYGELLSLLDDMGFIAFGGRTGIPNLADVTCADAWHTGRDTDPWEWKRMLSERRDGIYTRVEGGQALFISHAWHPVFIAAYTPALPLEERWEMGQVSRPCGKCIACFCGRIPGPNTICAPARRRRASMAALES